MCSDVLNSFYEKILQKNNELYIEIWSYYYFSLSLRDF